MFGEIESDSVLMSLAITTAKRADLTVKELITELITGRGKVVVKFSTLVFVEKDPETE